MRLFAGTTEDFIEITVRNQIVDRLRKEFETYYGRKVGPSESVSWNNSLQFLKNIFEYFELFDNMIILEYELPYSTERIDCLIFGKSNEGAENVMLIELKQWEKVKDCDIDENVLTFVGGNERMVAHPSYQVKGYHLYLKDFLEFFEDEQQVHLSSCSYCHNYSRNESPVLFLPKFHDILKEFPVFTKEDFENLGNYIKGKIGNGQGLEIFDRFITSRIRPSKRLVDYTSEMIKGQKVFHLIDEQLTANNTIIDRAKKASKSKRKSVIIVNGGPGTGKSLIALNAVAELLSKGMTVFHATGSAAFTTTVRKVVGSRAARLFKYFNSFGTASENEIDVLICDEAHRIRKTSESRFTKRHLRTGKPQVEELISAAKVSIFFLDEYQIVRPSEVGSVKLIKETAEKFGAEVFDFELKTQFRCSGSDGYLNWIDNILEIRQTANRVLTKNEKMEFKIFNSPHELREAIMNKNSEKYNSARLVAGFCWNWSDPNPDGTLKSDIIIGDFKATWEAKNDAKKLAPDIPKASLWAYDPKGVNQVGSIYTIQGFEFDYVGVIWGKDLVYDPVKKEWIGKPENSADASVKRDRENFAKYVRNVYRTLLTRGMKGVYVYFMDKDTEEFFKSRIEEK